MCWTSDVICHEKIVTQDIICYKVFSICDAIIKKKKSLGLSYNREYLAKVKSLYEDYPYIANGQNPTINLHIMIHPNRTEWFINEEYHSYATLQRAILVRTIYELVVKCIIPKGSRYYINKYEEIVSSNIIVIDEIVN